MVLDEIIKQVKILENEHCDQLVSEGIYKSRLIIDAYYQKSKNEISDLEAQLEKAKEIMYEITQHDLGGMLPYSLVQKLEAFLTTTEVK